MRILQLTTGFIPQRGGIETVSSLLAREFDRMGHESVVLTRTRSTDSPARIQVYRDPTPLVVLREVFRADAVILHGVPMRLAWPLAWLRRNGVIVKHMWDPPARSRLRAWIARRHPAVCVSRYMSTLGGARHDVLPNPYDHTVFNELPDTARDRDLVFMGRITRDKGIYEFVHLLQSLAAERPGLTATVVGAGPDLQPAIELIREAGLSDRVRFTGELAPDQAAAELRRHSLLVFPALWDEPFGLVALEAVACGAAVVGYNSGGIGEAVGPCGVLVPTGDRGALTETTRRLLCHEADRRQLLAGRDEHLARHRADAVARRYLEYLQTTAPGSR